MSGIRFRRDVFFRLRIKFRKLINSCPRRLRIFAGPLLGGLIGLMGGIPGFLIGILLGSLLARLFAQSRSDVSILNYFDYPGSQYFYESEPGLAAWCALGVFLVSKNYAGELSGPPVSEEIIIKQVTLAACNIFTGQNTDPSLIEHFSRLAWSRGERLNPDLLSESLSARRVPLGDAGKLGGALFSLAESEKARTCAREIRLILDPAWDDTAEALNRGREMPGDPWKILGLPPGTALKEVKTHYRKLAKLFHPDELQILDEKHRETAAQAFMAIREAYMHITGG